MGLLGVAVAALAYAAPASGALECGDGVSKDRKLTKNLTCPASTTALTITADKVTLDLNGHTISGGGMDSYGVLVDGVNRATVTNGTIRSFDYGVRAIDSSKLTLSNLDVRNAPVNGVRIQQVNGATLTKNDIRNSGGDNVNVHQADDIEVRNNHLVAGGLNMIDGSGYVAAGNRIIETNGVGIGARAGIGITDATDMQVTGNYIEDSSSSGIGVGSAFTLRIANNEIKGGASAGISLVGNASGTKILDNEVRGAGAMGSGDGIFIGAAALANVRGNRVLRSADDGIDNQAANTPIKRNVANRNGDYGIESVADPFAVNNTASGNGNPAECTPATACN